jgi:hypothetical protein
MLTGCLILLPVPRAWAGPGPVVYEPQGFPDTPQEAAETALAIRAGLDVFDAVRPQPAPPRQYVAFLSSLWQRVFGLPFNFGHSGLLSYDWISNGTGAAHGQTNAGVSFDADILLSVAFPNDDRIGMTPSQMSMFESAGASFGLAWVHFTSDIGDAKLLATWIKFNNTQDGVPVTVIAPLQPVLDDDWDQMVTLLPMYLDFLDEMWDFDVYYPEAEDPGRDFEREKKWSIRRTMRSVGGTILIGMTAVIAIAIIPVTAPVAAAAAAAIIITKIGVLIAVGKDIDQHYITIAHEVEILRDALRDGACGFPNHLIDVDTLSLEELLFYAKNCNPDEE